MTNRNSYHTTLKELVHYGLIPQKYIGKIPKTNISRWKNDNNIQRHVGSEINDIADNHTELIKTLNQYPKMFYAYGRLVKTLSSIITTTKDFNCSKKGAREQVVDAILRTREIIPIYKAVKIFKISVSTFYTWVSDVKLTCSRSYFKRCNKMYSAQITPSEVRAIKYALLDRKTLHWSIRSVHLKGLRDGTISVSENTM